MIPVQTTEAIHASALLGLNNSQEDVAYGFEDSMQDLSEELSFESPLFRYAIVKANAWPSGSPDKSVQLVDYSSIAALRAPTCTAISLFRDMLLEKLGTPKKDEQLQDVAYANIPSRINALIKELSLPKSVLAKALGVERPTLYAWLKGSIGTPRAENILRLERLEKICTLIPEEIRRTFPILRFRHITPKGMSLEELLLDEKISPEDISTWVIQDKEAWENRAEGRGADNAPSLLSSISSPVLLEDE